jgi:Fic family protein
MQRGTTGRYLTSTTGGESVRAFVPAPLPPNPPIDITPQRQRMLERALLACGRLDAISALLPETDLFLYAYVRREAVLSSQIEGTQSSLSDLLLFEMQEAPGAPFDDVVEVSNYVAALEHGLARLREDFPLSNRLIREMHAELLATGRGAALLPGEFRRSQNWIGGTRPGNAVFVPPPPQEVEACMKEFESYLHDERAASALLKAALAHLQFETIHPFLDGNGRVGRLLIALILHHDGVLKQPLLYLSLYFKTHRADYYSLLDKVRQDGDWEAWVDFFLDGVISTATSAVSTAHRLLALFSNDAARIRELGRATANALRVFDALRARPVISLPRITERAGIAFTTAARMIEELRALGIVREITGRKRERVYAYQAYLDILNEGAEPL